MKTIDLRGRESPGSICALPDIPEEDEHMGFVVVKLDHKDDKSDHVGTEMIPYEREEKEKRLGWLWRPSLSLIRKCCGRRVEAVKTAGCDVNFDVSA